MTTTQNDKNKLSHDWLFELSSWHRVSLIFARFKTSLIWSRITPNLADLSYFKTTSEKEEGE